MCIHIYQQRGVCVRIYIYIYIYDIYIYIYIYRYRYDIYLRTHTHTRIHIDTRHTSTKTAPKGRTPPMSTVRPLALNHGCAGTCVCAFAYMDKHRYRYRYVHMVIITYMSIHTFLCIYIGLNRLNLLILLYRPGGGSGWCVRAG